MAASRSRSRTGKRTCRCARRSRSRRSRSTRSSPAASASQRYREWLAKLNYGNAEVGDVVDRFWLDGPLKISAVEQAQFVAALAQGKLPASTHTQAIVRDILKQEVKDGRILYAKTGWYIPKNDNETQIGWWTGWVDDGGKISAFSLNIDIDTVDDARKRQEITKTLLAKLGVY